jgi:hypothetical protein
VSFCFLASRSRSTGKVPLNPNKGCSEDARLHLKHRISRGRGKKESKKIMSYSTHGTERAALEAGGLGRGGGASSLAFFLLLREPGRDVRPGEQRLHLKSE